MPGIVGQAFGGYTHGGLGGGSRGSAYRTPYGLEPDVHKLRDGPLRSDAGQIGKDRSGHVPTAKAVKELGFFGNQNTVCRPTDPKWNHTVERLKQVWGVE